MNVYAIVGLWLVGALLVVSFVRGAATLEQYRELVGTAVGGVGAVHEALLAISAKLSSLTTTLTEIQAPNDLRSKLVELDTRVQQSQLVVSDAVEKVTALMNRVATRDQRARKRAADALDLDDDDEGGDALSPDAKAEALRQLGITTAPTREPDGAGQGRSAARGSSWDRVRRKAATQRPEG